MKTSRHLTLDRHTYQPTLEVQRDKVMTWSKNFLTMVSGKVGLIIEIKATSNNDNVCPPCAQKYWMAIREVCSICSFRPEIIRWFTNATARQFIRGQLIENMLRENDSHTPLDPCCYKVSTDSRLFTRPNYLSVEYRHCKVFSTWFRMFRGCIVHMDDPRSKIDG
jgi:hypothetical protein